MSVKILGAAALLSAIAQAANVNVHNKCNFDVQATPSHEGADDSSMSIKAGDTHSWPASGEAWCLKLYGPGASNPTQLEWSTWGANLLSYDLSDIDMHSDTTFLQYGMSLTSQDPTCKGSDSTCKPAICHPTKDPSNTPCQDAYNQPFDPRTLGASANYDIDMTLCTGNSGSSNSGSSGSGSGSGSGSQPAPQPQPQQPAPQQSTTLATSATPAPSPQGGHPLQVDGQGHAYVGNNAGSNVVTQYVANTAVVVQTVTKVARDAEETAIAEPIRRRHIHHHGHHDS